jgi:glycosyltransferase involved in cell wall biosynthesis
MRILLAVHHLPPRYRGGGEAFTLRLARKLAARGNDVQLVAIESIDQGPRDAATWVDETLDGVAVRRVSFDLGAAPDADRWEYDNPWVGGVLEDLIRRGHPDVFHLVSGYLMTGRALRVAKEQGIPSVVSLTDYWFLCRRITMLRSDDTLSTLPINPATCARCLGEEQRRFRIPGKLAPGLMRAFWRTQHHRLGSLQARNEFLTNALLGADALMSPSGFLRTLYRRAGIAAADFSVITHGPDLPRVESVSIEKSDSPRLRIGYLGQIAWHKGVHILIEAVRLLEGAPLSLRIYGDPGHFPEYARHLEQLSRPDPRISMAGPYRGMAELPSVLRELDVVVVPSVWYENCPNVILEAFAHRTPVIVTNLGGMAEMVSHGRSGLLFRVGDAADLAVQLRRLLSEPGLLPTLRDGVPAVKTFADEVSEIEAVYRRVIEARAVAPALA